MSPGFAQTPQTAEPTLEVSTLEEERLLGTADEDARARDLLPFSREFGASGVVAGSLADSIRSAGVPPAAMVDALRAFDGAADPQDGDAFYVRWEQTYAIEGHPIGVGKVLWGELRT